MNASRRGQRKFLTHQTLRWSPENAVALWERARKIENCAIVSPRHQSDQKVHSFWPDLRLPTVTRILNSKPVSFASITPSFYEESLRKCWSAPNAIETVRRRLLPEQYNNWIYYTFLKIEMIIWTFIVSVHAKCLGFDQDVLPRVPESEWKCPDCRPCSVCKLVQEQVIVTPS